jgi:hypothetical protein
MPNCAICNRELKLIPAGFSKATGRHYNSFYACEDKTHKQPRTGIARPTYQQTTYQQPKEEKPNWEKISVGKCKHGFLIEAFKLGIDLKTAEPLAEEWAKASMRLLDEPSMRNFGKGDELDQIPFPDSEIPN